MQATRGRGFLENFLAGQRAKTADRLIPEGMRNGRILDIGCGMQPVFLLGTRFKEKHGMDKCLNDKDGVLMSKGIRIRRHDVEKELTIPFEDCHFDAVSMLAVFEHIEPEKLNAVLREIRRVLKKDGIYILTTPAPWTDRLLRLMARAGAVSKEEIFEHKDAYGRGKIRRLLEEAGFEPGKMRFGYFEAFMNIWAVAAK